MRHREDDAQQSLFQWARMMSTQVRELALLHHVPNGGRRRKSEAARLSGLGVKPGVPDLCLPVARGEYHGLYIEMKGEKAPGYRPTVSKEQEQWIADLTAQGYRAVVCYGWIEARDELKHYLGIDAIRRAG